ncbi:MAG: sensor histidine kinase [Bacteroidetes bacterium]|jgi:two-component system, NarL family, sensor kinase|nr:sensor histidine kinase [Bacteroidota bacterium]
MNLPGKNYIFSMSFRNAAVLFVALLILVFVFLTDWKMFYEDQLVESPATYFHDLDFFFQDSVEIEDFNRAWDLLYYDPDSARVLAYKAIERFEKQQNEIAQIRYFNILGVSFLLQSDYNKALEYSFRSLQLSIKYNIGNQIANSNNNIGVVYATLGLNTEALTYLLKAKSIREQGQDSLFFARGQINIGIIYLRVEAFETAKTYLDMAYNMLQKLNEQPGIASASNSLGSYYRAVNMPDSAEYFIDQAIKIGTQVSDHSIIANALLEKGNLFSDLGDHKNAIAYYLKSDSLSSQISFSQGRSLAQIEIAKAYLRLKELDSAFTFTRSAYDIALKIGNKKLEYEINEVFSLIFHERKEFEKALNYRNLSIEQKSEFQAQSHANQMYRLEIEELNRDKEKQQIFIAEQNMHIASQRNQMHIAIISFFALLIILSFIYYYLINKNRQKQTKQAYENKIRHSLEMTKAVLEAEIQERKRLGMELHDGLGPLLGIVKLNITNILREDGLSPNKRKELLKSAATNLDDILKEMKNISKNLVSLVLIEKGFESAVKDLVIRLQNLQYFDVHLSMNGWDNRVDSFVEHSLYRAILEVMNNIISHANASVVNIEVLKNGREITIIIEDNGVGFDPSTSGNNGQGLKNAATRIEGMGGNFFIDSKPNRGTIIIMELPNGDFTKMKDEKDKVVSG